MPSGKLVFGKMSGGLLLFDQESCGRFSRAKCLVTNCRAADCHLAYDRSVKHFSRVLQPKFY